MAFGCGELGLRLEEVYDMPFCEFKIKSYAFRRMQEERLRHTRLIAFSSQIGSHLDPKKMPKSIEQFMPIGSERKKKRKSKVSDEMRAIFEQRMKEYNEAVALKKKQEEATAGIASNKTN